MSDPRQAVTAIEALTPQTLEIVLGKGDLKDLTPAQRVQYYITVCQSLGLNWQTRPFDWLRTKSGEIHLYPNASCAAQLRARDGIHVVATQGEMLADLGVYKVTIRARNQAGREDEMSGYVAVKNLTPTDLANALMKAETVAHRRVTLSLAGLGWTAAEEMQTGDAGYTVSVTDEGRIQEPSPPGLADRVRQAAAEIEVPAAESPASDPPFVPPPEPSDLEGYVRSLREHGASDADIEKWVNGGSAHQAKQRLQRAWRGLMRLDEEVPC